MFLHWGKAGKHWVRGGGNTHSRVTAKHCRKLVSLFWTNKRDFVAYRFAAGTTTANGYDRTPPSYTICYAKSLRSRHRTATYSVHSFYDSNYRWPTRHAAFPEMFVFVCRLKSFDLDVWPFDLQSLSLPLLRETNIITKSEVLYGCSFATIVHSPATWYSDLITLTFRFKVFCQSLGSSDLSFGSYATSSVSVFNELSASPLTYWLL